MIIYALTSDFASEMIGLVDDVVEFGAYFGFNINIGRSCARQEHPLGSNYLQKM